MRGLRHLIAVGFFAASVAADHHQVQYNKLVFNLGGMCVGGVCKIVVFFTPSPPSLHLATDLYYRIQATSLTAYAFGGPPPPSVQISFKYGPF